MEKNTVENSRGRRNEVIGVVVSDKMDKTISVNVSRQVKHKKYGKFIKLSSTFKAHDEDNEAQSGDRVCIFETKPFSKTKTWKLAKVLEKARV